MTASITSLADARLRQRRRAEMALHCEKVEQDRLERSDRLNRLFDGDGYGGDAA